jgi:hypothetical protein
MQSWKISARAIHVKYFGGWSTNNQPILKESYATKPVIHIMRTGRTGKLRSIVQVDAIAREVELASTINLYQTKITLLSQ